MRCRASRACLCYGMRHSEFFLWPQLESRDGASAVRVAGVPLPWGTNTLGNPGLCGCASVATTRDSSSWAWCRRHFALHLVEYEEPRTTAVVLRGLDDRVEVLGSDQVMIRFGLSVAPRSIPSSRLHASRPAR